MRNSENYMITTGSEPLTTDDETTWSFPGAIVGFVWWLLALGIPFLIYGGNTLFFFLYTWPFFLALMPVAVVVIVLVNYVFNCLLRYSTILSIACFVVIFGLLFVWLMD